MPKWKVQAARRMRDNQTPAELQFWRLLRAHRLRWHFHRQIRITGYIVDFWAPEWRLAVEIDGGYHGTPKQRVYDDRRDKAIRSLGINLIRFTNAEVLTNPASVIERIRAYAPSATQAIAL